MSKNLDTILAILKNEVDGDVSAALEKMGREYSMTWMYQGKSDLFPSSLADFENETKDIYRIRGRKYEIKNTAEGDDVVMVELIESYPNSETGTLHQTPLVLVLEMQDGKIRTGRHYCDPQLSHQTLAEADFNRAYRDTPTKQIIQEDGKTDRIKLTKLIEEEGGKKWWVPAEFEQHVRSRLPTDLEVIAPPPAYSGNYNCFVYAFGLENDPVFLGGQNPIQKEFVRYLLAQHILEIVEQPVSDSLVFYEDDSGAITHGGIMRSANEVISKWMWGATIQHGLWDVPSSFGDKVFFCEPVPSSVIKQEYEKYGESGVKIEPIQ